MLSPDVRPNFILNLHGFEMIPAAAKAGATVYDVAYVKALNQERALRDAGLLSHNAKPQQKQQQKHQQKQQQKQPREQRSVALNKSGKFPPGSRPTEFCLVAADYATGTSNRPCNGASCPRCTSHGTLIRDFLRGKSGAEIIDQFKGKWLSARARALLQSVAPDTPPAPPVVSASVAALHHSAAALTAQFAIMSSIAQVPFSPGPTGFVNAGPRCGKDRGRLIRSAGSAATRPPSAAPPRSRSARSRSGSGDAQRATQIARASVLSGADRLGALAAIDPGSDNQPPPFFNAEISTPRGPVTSSFICDTGNTAGMAISASFYRRYLSHIPLEPPGASTFQSAGSTPLKTVG